MKTKCAHCYWGNLLLGFSADRARGKLHTYILHTRIHHRALCLLSAVYICVLLLPQYIYKFSPSQHTHKVVSESRHPHHHPWFAFPLILYLNFLHSLNSATSHPSACPASRIIWGFHLLSHSLLLYSSYCHFTGNWELLLTVYHV